MYNVQCTVHRRKVGNGNQREIICGDISTKSELFFIASN